MLFSNRFRRLSKKRQIELIEISDIIDGVRHYTDVHGNIRICTLPEVTRINNCEDVSEHLYDVEDCLGEVYNLEN